MGPHRSSVTGWLVCLKRRDGKIARVTDYCNLSGWIYQADINNEVLNVCMAMHYLRNYPNWQTTH
jgi:hypothetical protein